MKHAKKIASVLIGFVLVVVLLLFSGASNAAPLQAASDLSSSELIAYGPPPPPNSQVNCPASLNWVHNPNPPGEIPSIPSSSNFFCGFYNFSWQWFLDLMSPSANNSDVRNFQDATQYPTLQYEKDSCSGDGSTAPTFFVRTVKDQDDSVEFTIPERINQAGRAKATIYSQNGDVVFYTIAFGKNLCNVKESDQNLPNSNTRLPDGALNETIELKGSWKTIDDAEKADYIWMNADVIPEDPTTNVALNKAASQSSTDYSGVASYAVDGNTDGNFFDYSVTHTEYQSQAWWQVDLGEVYDIGTINLFNRTDCCSDRLSHFVVLVASDPLPDSNNVADALAHATWYQEFPGTAGTEEPFTVNHAGRYVRVQLNGTNYLSLAEVEVMGAPPLEETLGLVGFHIAHSTPQHPEQLWITFEHKDNVPECINPAASPAGGWSFLSETCAQCLANPTASCFNACKYNNAQKATALTTATPSEICRPFHADTAPGDNFASTNIQIVDDLNNQLVNPNNGILTTLPDSDPMAVLKNYFNIGALWIQDPQTEDSSSINNQAGSLRLANSTMETIDQAKLSFNAGQIEASTSGSFNCFACHTYKHNQGTAKSGLSHIIDDILKYRQ